MGAGTYFVITIGFSGLLLLPLLSLYGLLYLVPLYVLIIIANNVNITHRYIINRYVFITIGIIIGATIMQLIKIDINDELSNIAFLISGGVTGGFAAFLITKRVPIPDP